MAVAATAGLAGVLIAHQSGGAHLALSHAGSGSAGSGSSSSGSSTSPPSSGSSSGPPSSTAPGGNAAPSGPSKSATGALEQYGYGEMSVKVTVSGTKVLSVSVATLRVADQYSQAIADQVVPMLRHEVLQASSARISAVAGATYTSEAYAASVQSALDKLGVK